MKALCTINLPLACVLHWLEFFSLQWFSWQKPRDSSVEVRSDWEVKEEMDFPQLMKMRYLEVSEPQDMWVALLLPSIMLLWVDQLVVNIFRSPSISKKDLNHLLKNNPGGWQEICLLIINLIALKFWHCKQKKEISYIALFGRRRIGAKQKQKEICWY